MYLFINKGYDVDGLWGQKIWHDNKITSSTFIPMSQGNITPMNNYICQNIEVQKDYGYATYLFDDLNTL